MPTLKEAKEKVIDLSTKALAVAEDTTYKSFSDQAAALEPLEKDIKHWENEVQELMTIEAKRKSFAASAGGSLDDAPAETRAAAVNKSVGQQFVESDGYKNLIASGLKGGNWNSGEIEIKDAFGEGTAASPLGGFSLVGTPTVLPGIVDQKFKKLTISDLFPQGTTTTPLVRYLVESMVINGAGAVKESDLKPVSTLTFTQVDETLHKIATFLPMADEMLEDWAQAMSYINARLGLFVQLAEEAQLLTGDGTGANLVGILNRTGLAPNIVKGAGLSAASDNSMDAIYRQITQIRITQFLEPDAIAIDPLGWQTITIAKNSVGAYYASGPFIGLGPETLWGKKVATTPSIAANSALVGAFEQGGQIFRKGGIVVAASNSHADFFQRNQTALRAEERLALAIYRPGAFGTVTGL